MKELYNTLSELGFKDDKGGYLPMLSKFVLKVFEMHSEYEALKSTIDINNYVGFITQPLKKEMFVPCDEDGNVLEKPLIPFDNGDHYGQAVNNMNNGWLEYQQALERVVFEGWVYHEHDRNCWLRDKNSNQMLDIILGEIGGHETIEQAINNGVKLYLRKP